MPVEFPFPTRPAPSADVDVVTRVRLLLSPEGAAATSPSEEDIAIHQQDVEDDLTQRYPCLLAALTPAEQRAYEQAVAALVAVRLVASPGGQEWARYVVELKQGQIQQKFATGQSIEQASAFLRADADRALLRIACIRSARGIANKAARRSGMMGLGAATPSRCRCEPSRCGEVW